MEVWVLSPGRLCVPITCPYTKEEVLPHRRHLSALLPASRHTHRPVATVTVPTAWQWLPLHLFFHLIRGIQIRRSPHNASTRCHLWKAASPLNTLASMKGRQNPGSHAPPCFLSVCLLLSSCLFEADNCLLLPGLYQVSRWETACCTHVPESPKSILVQFVAQVYLHMSSKVRTRVTACYLFVATFFRNVSLCFLVYENVITLNYYCDCCYYYCSIARVMLTPVSVTL